MTEAAPDSRPIDGEPPVTDQRDRCDRCAVPLAVTDAQLVGYASGEAVLAWAFCLACYELLLATAERELGIGPAWPSRSRAAEARVRRRHRSRQGRPDKQR